VVNESVPKIITNDNFFLNLRSAFWQFQTITVSERCLMKLLPYIVFKKHINILALEMTSPGNRHCDNCINALSFPIRVVVMVDVRISYGWGEASTDKKREKKMRVPMSYTQPTEVRYCSESSRHRYRKHWRSQDF